MSENTSVHGSIDAQLSRDFAKMSFICAIMIVYLHMGCAARGEIIFQLIQKTITSLCQVAIPWFFFASGFFLSRHIGEECWWSREMIKRIRSLLVPFWIWGMLIFFVYCSIGIYFYSHRKLFAQPLYGILGVVGVGLLILKLTVATQWRVLDVLMVPGLMVIVYHCVSRMRIPTMLATMSFPIYVMHIIFTYCISALYGVIGVGGEGRTLFVLGIVRFFAVLGSAILVTLLLRRQFPIFAKILFGGR